MYKLEYEDEFCRKLESYFIEERLAYSWIKYQKNLREWTLFNSKEQIVDYYKNANAD